MKLHWHNYNFVAKFNKEIIFNEHADKLNAILKLGYYLSVCYFEQIEDTLLHTAVIAKNLKNCAFSKMTTESISDNKRIN